MNTYTERAQNTKARRQAQYQRQREQKAAMKAYSEAMRVWREGGKVGERPLMATYWKW